MTPGQKPALPSARIVALCGVGFLILASYSIVRPPTESLFLAAFGSDALPVVWLAVAATTLLVVTLYNRYAASIELGRLFAAVCAFTGAALLLIKTLGALDERLSVFLLYVWKDVYIVILVELFWTFANATFRHDRARWLYGLFLIAGTLGSGAGNLAVGRLVSWTELTSATVLWLSIPVLAAGASLFFWLGKDVSLARLRRDRLSGLSEGFSLIRRSRYVALLVGLIFLTQIVITLIDYQYNTMLEVTYPDTDERTVVGSLVYSSIDLGALVLQGLAGPILRLAGAGTTLLVIPLLLAGALVAFAAVPHFLTMVVSKVASKTFDYSLFRVAKELLYIPLSYREQTQGKALADILSYRVAKAAASLLLLGLIAIGSFWLSTAASLVAVAAWVWVTWLIIARQRLASKADPTQV